MLDRAAAWAGRWGWVGVRWMCRGCCRVVVEGRQQGLLSVVGVVGVGHAQGLPGMRDGGQHGEHGAREGGQGKLTSAPKLHKRGMDLGIRVSRHGRWGKRCFHFGRVCVPPELEFREPRSGALRSRSRGVGRLDNATPGHPTHTGLSAKTSKRRLAGCVGQPMAVKSTTTGARQTQRQSMATAMETRKFCQK